MFDKQALILKSIYFSFAYCLFLKYDGPKPFPSKQWHFSAKCPIVAVMAGRRRFRFFASCNRSAPLYSPLNSAGETQPTRPGGDAIEWSKCLAVNFVVASKSIGSE